MNKVWNKLLQVHTPKALMWFGGITLASALVIGVTVAEVTSITRQTVQTIGYDAAPSVTAAENLKAHLAGLYADVANELLTGVKTTTSDDYIADIAKFSDGIISSSKNITYEDEYHLIANIQRSMAYLFALVGEIRNGSLSDKVSAFVNRNNVDYMLSQATMLGKANEEPLENAYRTFLEESKISAYGAMVLFATFLGFLAVIQLWLMKKTRRIVNLPIAAATGIAVLSSLWITYAIIQERVSVRVAKIDAYNSLNVLYRAKALLYHMNAIESLWLLDNNHGYEQTFLDEAKLVLDIDYTNAASIITALDAAVAIEKRDGGYAADKATPKIAGLFGKEIDNITFGIRERQPATNAIRYFIKYMELDRQIRTLETSWIQSGGHAKAIALCIGSSEGPSDRTFSKLIGALDQTIQTNADEFKDRVDSSMGLLKAIPLVSIGSLLLISLLVSFGLWQRYQEYT